MEPGVVRGCGIMERQVLKASFCRGDVGRVLFFGDILVEVLDLMKSHYRNHI